MSTKTKIRQAFIFYRSFYESLSGLPIEDQGLLYSAICGYILDSKKPTFSGVNLSVWLLIKPQLDANIRKYKNGVKGGRAKAP